MAKYMQNLIVNTMTKTHLRVKKMMNLRTVCNLLTWSLNEGADFTLVYFVLLI